MDVSETFVGRRHDLRRLKEHLDSTASGTGRLLVVRGRRQVGKSRLVTEFVRKSKVPHLFVTASLQASERDDLAALTIEAERTSTLPGRDLLTSNTPTTWDGALRLIAAALPTSGPSIVVFDEFPWFMERSQGLEGTLQVAWDRVFESKSVLMILIGSDVAVMDAITTHGRPLYGRPRELHVKPFTPIDTAAMLDREIEPSDAFDLSLVTGGLPRLVQAASSHASVVSFVHEQLEDESSVLCTSGARSLSAELPSGTQASVVLHSIGTGERTFRNIADAAKVGDAQLERALKLLRGKHLVARDVPTSVPVSDHPRYRIEDSYLRLWLALIEPSISDIERGRSDLARARFDRSWTTWRGRAVEPLVRESLFRKAASDERLGAAGHVSGWWPRNNTPEIDLVGVDRQDRPTKVCFVGSIKWRESAAFTDADLRSLSASAAVVPGVDSSTPQVAVARTSVLAAGCIGYTARDLIAAWA